MAKLTKKQQAEFDDLRMRAARGDQVLALLHGLYTFMRGHEEDERITSLEDRVNEVENGVSDLASRADDLELGLNELESADSSEP